MNQPAKESSYKTFRHKMSPQLPIKVNTYLLVLLFSAWLANCSGDGGSSEATNTGIQCAERERAALLQFKQGIRVDNCGLLRSWEDGVDCCQWRGIHCNNHSGHVIGLHLPGIFDSNNNNDRCLEGKLSDSLLELKHLKYLDLSSNTFIGRMPKFIGSLANLEHLNLSNAGFDGVVPQEIGNLSRLSSLDINHQYGANMGVESLQWLSRLRLLKQLDLSHIDLSVATATWLPIVNSLSFLQVLRLDECKLSSKLSSPLSYINSSSTLNVLSLSDNNMNDTSIFEWLFKLKGLATSLEYLDLSFNNIQVSGRAIKFIGSLCSLQNLGLSNTSLKFNFSEIVESLSVCPHNALMSLDLRQNQLWGSIPDSIKTLSSLRELLVGENQLNGTIGQALGGLSMLETLDLGSNNLKGVVTVEHLSNLSKLSSLKLGDNTELVVHISADWIPPFQLDTLVLESCKVGPHFPMWLTTQKHLTYIHLHNASIFDTIPVSFFNSLSSKLGYLSMSQNMLYGVLPNVSITFDVPPVIDFSSNNFHGGIPPFLRNVSVLFLNNNHLSQGLFHFLCPHNKMPLVSLNLQTNFFSDKLPDCWGYFDKLIGLHLENNKLWGNLPASIGELDQLNILRLSNNNISGELPTPLVNCKSLVYLDLSHNSLTGSMPYTFGNSFKHLTILTLQNNKLSGALPSSLCNLSQIQILELSSTFINGAIPRCIYNLKAMANTSSDVQPTSFPLPALGLVEVYDNNASIMWKRKDQFFIRDQSNEVKVIDFSNNKLEGRIPDGISSLVGLRSINLSRNHLSGAIPSKIGQLTSLESLDLSYNHLSGEIPTSLVEISALGVLDFSYNSLSGKIPTGTQLQGFNASTYMGNLGLCGPPLPKCKGDEAATIPQSEDNATSHNKHHIDDFMPGMYISVVLGVITGFWGVCGTLVLKRSWRHAFFRFYDEVKDKIYVFVVVYIARLWRRS